MRAELDALPIDEALSDLRQADDSKDEVSELDATFPHRSIVEGVSHKCGHDGHMSIVLGAAHVLAARPPSSGSVLLLFQPAEETGEGMQRMLNDIEQRVKSDAGLRGQVLSPPMSNSSSSSSSSSSPSSSASIPWPPTLCLALHNTPGFPAGHVLCRPGPFALASAGLKIAIKGKPAHASQPQEGISPAPLLAHLALALPGLPNNIVAVGEAAKVTVTYLTCGEPCYGVAPADGEIRATIRADSDANLEKIIAAAKRIAQYGGQGHDLVVSCSVHEAFAATTNSQEGYEIIRQAAQKSSTPYSDLAIPFPWSEDFGVLTDRYRGGMFALGAGKTRAHLHTIHYDFPDQILSPAIATMVCAARLHLQ